MECLNVVNWAYHSPNSVVVAAGAGRRPYISQSTISIFSGNSWIAARCISIWVKIGQLAEYFFAVDSTSWFELRRATRSRLAGSDCERLAPVPSPINTRIPNRLIAVGGSGLIVQKSNHEVAAVPAVLIGHEIKRGDVW